MQDIYERGMNGSIKKKHISNAPWPLFYGTKDCQWCLYAADPRQKQIQKQKQNKNKNKRLSVVFVCSRSSAPGNAKEVVKALIPRGDLKRGRNFKCVPECSHSFVHDIS